MSRSAALIWLLVALILGVIVWSTTPRSVLPSASAQFLPDFSPAQVSQIEIAWPGGDSARLSKADSRWILEAPAAKDADSTATDAAAPPWPAETSRVQGLLRLISEARDGGDARAMPIAIFLTLTRESGEAIRLAIDPNTLGGAARIARLSDDGRVLSVTSVDAQFVRALESSAIESWRSKDLLFWAPEATTAFESRAAETNVEIAKSGGAWIMRAPIAVKADAATIEGSLLLLSKSGIDRFLPANTAHEDTWKLPARTIRIGSRSNAAANRRDLEQTIEVGPAVDSTSRMVRITARDAASNTTLWGPEVAIMNNATIEAIPSVPSAFVSRIALDLPAADIAAIEIVSAGQRTTIKRAAGGSFGEADATIRDLLRLLAESPASQVRILESATDTSAGASADSIRVRVLGPKSEPLGDVTLKPASVASKISGAPAVPAIEVIDRSVARSIPWQRPAEFFATLRAIKPQ